MVVDPIWFPVDGSQEVGDGGSQDDSQVVHRDHTLRLGNEFTVTVGNWVWHGFILPALRFHHNVCL